jgi:purine-nucleoside phosphorylase
MKAHKEAAEFIKSKSSKIPQVGIVLGSGLGDFINKISDPVVIPYSEIPHFQQTTIKGHAGKLVLGNVGGVPVAVMAGRNHYYEGHSIDHVVHPVRTLAELGIQKLILTNAAGGVNTNYSPGDLVVLTDHLNLTGNNPLIGKNDDEVGPRFPDMSETYNIEMREAILSSAKENNIKVQTGIYAGFTGPTYETPAEVQMVSKIGGDLVGMSTVYEAIIANHRGIKIAGVSCVTNMAAGISKEKLSHDDIKDQADKIMETFSTLLESSIRAMKS